MKVFIFAVFLFSFFNVSAAWDCTSESDCSEGMTCHEGTCITPSANFSTYAAVTLNKGENSPNSLGSNKIFVAHPAVDVVLGQLAVNAYGGGEDNKRFLFKELTATVVTSSLDMVYENFKIVYDSNGNGIWDNSEKVVASSEQTGSTVKFVFGQKTASYKMNIVENFLLIGDFSIEKEISAIWDFGIDIKPFTGANITNAGTVDIAAVPDKISFPRHSFEPQTGYFLFASGKHFPKAPSWKEMNKTGNIMHIRTKSLSGSNEIKSINVRLEGTVVSFGNGVDRIALYSDDNNDGLGDTLISEMKDFSEPKQSVLFQIPAGTLALDEGMEKHLVIAADLNFYNGQTTRFYISANDVILSQSMTVAGTAITTESFKYSCDESDPQCQKAPTDEILKEDEDTGCSIILIN